MATGSLARTVSLTWLAWAVSLLVFQSFVQARFAPERPDLALAWTLTETRADSNLDQPYLLEPLLNAQVAWDSEFYLAVATRGYDDPDVRIEERSGLSLSYAFMPLYPFVMRVVRLAFLPLGLTPIGASALAGVVISLAGALAGALALADLARDDLGDDGALRAAFYLLVFPGGFFLAQVYTEGLFVGLAFGCLALARRRRWLVAGLLAFLAAWTRTVGVLLVIPLALMLVEQDRRGAAGDAGDRPRGAGALVRWLAVAAPAAGYLSWRLSPLGAAFAVVQDNFFGRALLNVGATVGSWEAAFERMAEQPQAAAYYAVELGAIALALVAGLALLRSSPALALFSLAVVVVSLLSGPAQGMHRYVLAAPALFLFLSRLGRSPAFDRGWSLFSILIMAVMAAMFSFDMWAG